MYLNVNEYACKVPKYLLIHGCSFTQPCDHLLSISYILYLYYFCLHVIKKCEKNETHIILTRVGNPNPESAQFLANFGIRIRNPFFNSVLSLFF